MLGLVGRIRHQRYSRSCYEDHGSQARATLLLKQEQTMGSYNKPSSYRILANAWCGR